MTHMINENIEENKLERAFKEIENNEEDHVGELGSDIVSQFASGSTFIPNKKLKGTFCGSLGS